MVDWNDLTTDVFYFTGVIVWFILVVTTLAFASYGLYNVVVQL